MGDIILVVGMVCALLTSVGSAVAAVWHLVTLHPIWCVGDLGAACIAAALVVTFDRAHRMRRD